MRFVFLLAWALVAGCRSTGPVREAYDLVVIAPHPDDEVLMAGGLISQRVAEGKKVAVILVTNGDYTCERDGYQREAESVAALALLGVKATDVHFLGYPDGALRKLGKTPLPPMEHRDATGECIARTGTWADRSAGRIDEHSKRTGAPAEWTADALVGDLEALLAMLTPREVVVAHGVDDHPDHAMTYVYFRRALDRLPNAPVVVHRAVVHAGPCWPSVRCDPNYFTPELPMPPLPAPLAAYAPLERLSIDPLKKLNAIAVYVSQTGPDAKANWLSSFARVDEVFFPERYVRQQNHWERAEPTPGVTEQDRWGPDGYAGLEVRVP
ncbi:MAG: PIG-L family deacetylase [Myxococcaceae bacterium]